MVTIRDWLFQKKEAFKKSAVDSSTSAVETAKDKYNKVLMTICLDKELLKQFKKVAQKDLRKYSNIVEGSIRRYVQSKI